MASRRTGRPAEPTFQQLDKQIDRDIAKQRTALLAGHEATYRRNRDPFAAWWALSLCRQYGRRIPHWVWEYLDAVGPKLEAVRRAAPAQRPALLARALGFTRDGRPKSTAERNDEIALAVVEARRATASWKAAKYEVAGAWELGFDVVDRAYRDWKKRQKVP